jgi:hypothetical protein
LNARAPLPDAQLIQRPDRCCLRPLAEDNLYMRLHRRLDDFEKFRNYLFESPWTIR